MYGPASIAINTLHSNYVRFSVLAVVSIFFLVDPFAAIPAFLAITAGADQKASDSAWRAEEPSPASSS